MNNNCDREKPTWLDSLKFKSTLRFERIFFCHIFKIENVQSIMKCPPYPLHWVNVQSNC